jgi:hypothetical protein
MAPERREETRGGSFSRRASNSDIVDDAVLLATGAVRSAMKNLLIVRALRDGQDFDEAWWLDAVSREFEAIAVEKDDDAKRVEEDRQLAKRRTGQPLHPSDFRTLDVPNMKRRVRILNLIAARLRELGADRDTLLALIAEARTNALDEIASARQDAGRAVAVGSAARDSAARDAALALLADDLSALLEQHDSEPNPAQH